MSKLSELRREKDDLEDKMQKLLRGCRAVTIAFSETLMMLYALLSVKSWDDFVKKRDEIQSHLGDWEKNSPPRIRGK